MREIKINKEVPSNNDLLLVEKTKEGLGKYKEITEELMSRVEYELNVIIDMGFSDYFLIVQDFLDVGRRIGHMPKERMEKLRSSVYGMSIQEMNAYINEDQSYPGMTIGPGRGSAAGSVVAYLLGITSVEPISNGLLFERFLNPERVSMPDIDSDLSKSEYEYGVRDIVIEYVSKKYGHDGVCGITTPSTLAVKAAVKAVARVMASREYAQKGYTSDEDAKEVSHKYLHIADQINALVPEDPNATFGMTVSDGKTLVDIMKEAFKKNEDALAIIEYAKELEGVNINFGKHACGMIIADNGDIGEYAPLMFDSKTNGWKIQLNAEQSEAAGLLKMDFLGLKNLNVITKTARMVYENTDKAVYVDPLTVPQDLEVYKKVFSEGKTQAVFQFESDGMKKMLRQFQPESFSDIVLLVACYRPGPMDFLPDIITRKHGGETKPSVLDRVEAIQPIIAPTYKAIVYQEQVQQIFRTCAGYSLGQADNVRRAMGHKKMDVLIAEKKAFIHGDEERGIVGCIANGIKEKDADELFESMVNFAKYAFNKSHAAAYAMVSYITAYLKLHYPTEFYSSVLSFTELEDFPELIAEAKSFGVKVHGPSIGRSQSGFVGKNGEIFFGFSGIKGIKGDTEDLMASYSSFSDFMQKTKAGASTVDTLAKVGAFDVFCSNRAAVRATLPLFEKERERIKNALKKIEWAQKVLDAILSGEKIDRKELKITTKNLPTKESLIKKIRSAEEVIKSARAEMDGIVMPTDMYNDSLLEKLNYEKELLGMYVSGNPFDAYGEPKDFGCKKTSEIPEDKQTKICGIVSDFREALRSSDDAKMAFFTLSDQYGSVKVACFAKAYPSLASAFNSGVSADEVEGKALVVTGILKDDRGNRDKKIFMAGSGKENTPCITRIEMSLPPVMVSVNGVEEYKQLVDLLHTVEVPNGHPVAIFNKTTRKIATLTFKVSDEVFVKGVEISDMTGAV